MKILGYQKKEREGEKDKNRRWRKDKKKVEASGGTIISTYASQEVALDLSRWGERRWGGRKPCPLHPAQEKETTDTAKKAQCFMTN